MATTRTATAHWTGSLMEGQGTVSLDSSKIGSYDVTWAARSGEPAGHTSPEELLGAAHATCFSMALSHALAGAGHAPQSIETRADVTFQPGEGITGIVLHVRGSVAGIDGDEFENQAQAAGRDCPVSQALTGTKITVEATLAG